MKRTAWILAILIAASSCGGDTQGPVAGDLIDRETFIETYVDLRLAAIDQADFRITPELRAEILARHGVEASDLLEFADAYGRNLDFMNAVWVEVESRFEERANTR